MRTAENGYNLAANDILSTRHFLIIQYLQDLNSL
jgi:hypothetical protein